MKSKVLAGGAFLLWFLLVGVRTYCEIPAPLRGGVGHLTIGSQFDPRDFATVEKVAHARESASFKSRLRRGAAFTWPGLRSAQVSWTWLELLQGMHHPSSYDGDFSWMFSKLETVIENSPTTELKFVSTVLPFLLVIGHDPVGTNIVMDETLKRAPKQWMTWFWAGYNASENLHNNRLAGDLFEHAAALPGSPRYVALLAVKLLFGNEDLDPVARKNVLEANLLPEVLSEVRKQKPEWFN